METIRQFVRDELATVRQLATEARRGLKPWMYWIVAASFYLYEFFARVAPGVIEGTLQKEFSVDAAEVGLLMGLYYLSYAPMQLVVGMALDRFGSRRLLAAAALTAGLGCLVFATARSTAGLAGGRLLLGVGSAFAYVGAVYVATVWFPRSKLALIMGMTAALGTLGAALGEAPLEEAVRAFGWREAMYVAAIGGLVIGVLVYIVVPRRPGWFLKMAELEKKEASKTMFRGLVEVVSSGQTWLVAIISLLTYLPLSAFGALWGDSYLMASTGASEEAAAWTMSMLFFGFALGGPVLGHLSDRLTKRRSPILFGGMMTAVFMAILMAAEFLPLWMSGVVLAAAGFFAGAQTITFAVAVEQHSRSCRATAVAFVNFFVMLGGFLLQPAFGAVLDITSADADYSPADYRKALLLLPIGIALGAILCRWLKDPEWES